MRRRKSFYLFATLLFGLEPLASANTKISIELAEQSRSVESKAVQDRLGAALHAIDA